MLPGLGGVFILIVIYYGVKDASGVSPAFVAIAWVLVGLVVALVAGNLAKRIGASLTEELEDAEHSSSRLEPEVY